MKIEVDAGRVFDRQFTAVEQMLMPAATVKAVNSVAFLIREDWKREAVRVMDRPRPMTVNAVQYRKAGAVGGGMDRRTGYYKHASTGDVAAEVYIRDEAHKGTPPARYLMPQVEGGPRRPKGIEVMLQRSGVLPSGMFVVPGRGAQLDQFGNIKAGEISRILSQLGARFDPLQNESAASRKRRHKREDKKGIRRSDYFVVQKKGGSLAPGIWQRDRSPTGRGSGVWMIFAFVQRVQYRTRFDIYKVAERTWNKRIPYIFNAELNKALQALPGGRS